MSSIDPSGPPAEGGPTETVRAAVVPRLGGKLGRYELIEVVGHGAMATVFRARDTQLGREVAVKVMSLAVAARAESAERFRREAQAVAAVKHPGIVEIFDFVGATQTEPAYIVSELIQGPTLRQFLDQRRGRLLPEAAAMIGIPIAESLAVAHGRGIIHRDIKPDNVMLDRGGGKCRVVLTDFGVAHITGLETMTATGALVGSPAFMSPEQARGLGVGPASDLWALGVLIYEMATGHLPFPGKDALMVVASIARGLYKKPSGVSAYVGGGLDEICGRCLRLEPKERYADLTALVADLRGFCGAGGLMANERALRALVNDADAFENALRPQVADAAVAQARRHSRRGELGRALGELARACAYVPNHAEAERLVATISRRRRWLKVSGVAASVMAVAAAVVFLGPKVRDFVGRLAAVAAMERAAREASLPAPPEMPPPVPAAAVRPAGGTLGQLEARPPEPPAATNGPPANQSTVNRASFRRSKAAAHKKRGPRLDLDLNKAEKDLLFEGAKDPDISGIAEKVPESQPERPPQVVASPPAPSRPQLVEVRIYAQNLFCDPALGPRSPIRPSYTVAPGLHKVFCTMGSGPRVWVADIRIAPTADGRPFVISLKRSAGGGPAIDPDRTTNLSSSR